MKADKNHARTEAARVYNGRDVVRELRGVVDSTNDRDDLRLIDSQLTQLRRQIREKMRGRKASR